MKKNILAHLFEFAFRAPDQRSTMISCELLSNVTTNFAVYNIVTPNRWVPVLMGAREVTD